MCSLNRQQGSGLCHLPAFHFRQQLFRGLRYLLCRYLFPKTVLTTRCCRSLATNATRGESPMTMPAHVTSCSRDLFRRVRCCRLQRTRRSCSRLSRAANSTKPETHNPHRHRSSLNRAITYNICHLITVSRVGVHRRTCAVEM